MFSLFLFWSENIEIIIIVSFTFLERNDDRWDKEITGVNNLFYK